MDVKTKKKKHQTTIGKTKRRNEQRRNTKSTRKQGLKKAIRTYISIITLNINGLNAPIKRHRVAEWI